MKTLYLIRHAKSSWKHPELTDKERPLNKRGEKDAPFMGKLLREKHEIPDLIITSPAVRAYDTARAFAKELGIKKKKILISEKLYMPSDNDFYEVIKGTDNDINTVMLFSHNPGVTAFVNRVTEVNIDNIPTSGIVKIGFDISSWYEIKDKKGNLIFFEYPKKYK